MNFIDRALLAVAPGRALDRAVARRKFEILNSGYGNHGASTTKKALVGWTYAGGSAREDIQDHLSTLRQRTRDLYMGVPLATGAVKTMRTNVVGSGLRLKSRPARDILGLSEEQARSLERQIEREFALWADSTACDIERIDNFYELQQLAFLNWLVSGDVLALLPVTKRPNMPYDLRIRLVEADRLYTPYDDLDGKIVGGVEVNDDGEIVAYHIASHHPLSYENREYKWTRVEAWGGRTRRRNVLHIMNRERIGQRRGVPFLAPVIEALKQLGRYTDAELMAAVISGMYTVFIEKDAPGEDRPFGEVVPEDQQVDAGDESTIELAPGAIVDLNEGEKAHDMNPGRPNTAFDGFVTAITRQIGAALEIPYELLVKHFTASYSASRGALLEAWKMFRMYRTWLANDFCQPIFEEWMAEAVAKGRIDAPGFFADPLVRKAYTTAEWNGPAQGLLNPVQEVNAAKLRVENGFSTGSREAAEINGSDYYENVEQRRRERAAEKEEKDDGPEDETAK